MPLLVCSLTPNTRSLSNVTVQVFRAEGSQIKIIFWFYHYTYKDFAKPVHGVIRWVAMIEPIKRLRVSAKNWHHADRRRIAHSSPTKTMNQKLKNQDVLQYQIFRLVKRVF